MTMLRSDHQEKYYQLSTQYEFFSFEDFHIEITPTLLQCTYDFNLGGAFYFHPRIKIAHKPLYANWKAGNPEDEMLRNLCFHIGMVELISYWKTACPKQLIVKPYHLDDDQIEWWKNLYFLGLGEFFYLNGLALNKAEFMHISSGEAALHPAHIDLSNDYIVPVGGGKDSAVSLEILKTMGALTPLLQNPRGAMLDTLQAAGIALEDSIEIQRTLDPGLLSCNAMGFLNGHTPFSALLAFQSLLCAYLSGKRNIALSNESSANEATIPGTDINHQYSKSFAFESDFREYYSRYISNDFNYFSFLRPLSELQIAQLFSKFPQHHYSFRSCNAGSKTDSWCGKCPKCLFAWLIMSPFLGEQKLAEIFGNRLLDDPDMLFFLKQLMGKTIEKPFECIGTTNEVNLSLFLIWKKNIQNPPMLLKQLKAEGLIQEFTAAEVEHFFHRMETPHFLSEAEITLIQQHITCPEY